MRSSRLCSRTRALTDAWRTAPPEARLAGSEWYPDANRWAHATAAAYGVPAALVVNLTAVLSPGVSWDRNKADVGRLLADPKGYQPPTWPQGRAKARQLLAGWAFQDVVSYRTSPKVWSFRNNIADPTDSEWVTIDRWIARRHLGRDRLTWGQYQQIADDYRRAAGRLGVAACALQAAVWLMERNSPD